MPGKLMNSGSASPASGLGGLGAFDLMDRGSVSINKITNQSRYKSPTICEVI